MLESVPLRSPCSGSTNGNVGTTLAVVRPGSHLGRPVNQSVKHGEGNNVMNSEWVPTFKPSFLVQLQALPWKEMHQVLAKLTMLLEDPLPDGKMKKQLTHVNRDLYRLRCGDYRIIYTYRDPYISLLALRRRSEDTYDEDFDSEFLGGFDPDFGDIIDSIPIRLEHILTAQESEAKQMPQLVTEELLTNMRVPVEYRLDLLDIQTEDDLINCL